MTLPTALPRVLVRAAQQTDERSISPGVLGFLVTFAVVLACIPLFRSMTGKIRGVQYRAGLGADAGSGDDVSAPTVPDVGRGALPDAGPGTGSAADDGPGGPGLTTPEV